MVQLPFAGQAAEPALQQPSGQQQQVQLAGTTLALPALVGPPSQQSQYSPQSDLYQRQLIKGAQHYVQQQASYARQQQQHQLNGVHQQESPKQQAAASQSQQAQLEALYNGVSQRAPGYAPKQLYYSPSGAQPMYQARQQPNFYAAGQHQPSAGLSVRQLQGEPSAGGLQLTGAGILVPASNMSQLNGGVQQMLAYQQQAAEMMQQQQQQNFQVNSSLSQAPKNFAGQQSLRWPQQQQQQAQPQAQLVEEQRAPSQLPRPQHFSHPVGAASRFSDRDSISTVSRFNQFDERRSFTMRSQYTSGHRAIGAASSSNRFGFLELTGEALRRILGLANSAPADDSQRSRLLLGAEQTDANNLHKNLSLAAAASGATKSSGQANGGPKVGASLAIDSAEDYYFKRQVFKYQLVILRLLNLLCGALVLLSPVAMLLAPKMEFLFRPSGQPLVSESLGDAQDAASSPAPVGLGAVKRQPVGRPQVGATQASAYYSAQPQWRISDCSSTTCDAPLIGFVVRLLLLALAYWAIHLRPQTASLPRLDFHRCLLSALALLVTLAYWLFFVFRLFDKRHNDFELQYATVVDFAVSMLESLLLLHYLAVLLLELRHRKRAYCLKVVRSPDGASRYYRCGALSIQRCAQLVLDKYHCEFPHHSAYTEELLALEDQWARDLAGGEHQSRSREAEQERSRPSSPANSRSGRRSAAGRHHSRHRTRSPSPARSTRSRRKSRAGSPESAPKVYQLDADPKAAGAEQQQQQSAVAGESGEQSSDGTTKMNESSLETIKAANSNSDLLAGGTSAASSSQKSIMRNAAKSRAPNQQDETESVRSGRSRRSAGRHQRDRSASQHHAHRDRSAGRAAAGGGQQQGPNPLEEHERKLRRRKSRLLVNVQESFEQLKRLDGDEAVRSAATAAANRLAGAKNASSTSIHLSMPQVDPQAMGPNQAARSMYPSIARSLQKYLRLTRQTGRHNLQSIYEHLSKCLLYGLSARAFIEKFVNHDPVWQQSETNLFAHCTLEDSALISAHRQPTDLEINSWSLVSDTLVSRQIDAGTFFVLKQGQVSLLVTVARLPHLNLTEEVVDPSACKFVSRATV